MRGLRDLRLAKNLRRRIATKRQKAGSSACKKYQFLTFTHRALFARAPLAPDAPIGLLELPRKGCSAHEGRSFHALAKLRAKPREALDVPGKPLGDLDVLIRTRRDEIGQADAVQDAGAHAPDRRSSGQRHHRYPHPQGMAGRRAAIERSRVERDIDAAETLEVVAQPDE